MAKSNKGSKFYAVAKGRTPGIYNTWPECEAQVKGFGGAIFKSFKTIQEAESFVAANSSSVSSRVVQQSESRSTSADINKTQSKKRTAENIQEPRAKRVQSSEDVNYDFDVTIYFDGGSRGNPGVAGAGAEVVCTTKDKRTTYLIRQFCEEKQTNNYAEYTGLIVGLKQANSCINEHKQHTGKVNGPHLSKHRMRVYGDSNLVIQQMKGCWQCNNANIKPLYNEARKLYNSVKSAFGVEETISFEHVYRDQNRVADELANEAMDQKRSWITSSVEYDGKEQSDQNGKAKNKDVIELNDSDDGSAVSC